MQSPDVVTGINLYPIKAMHAATVDGRFPKSLDVGQSGLEAYGVRDREFVIVEADGGSDGLFVSQRGWNERKKTVHHSDAALATFSVNITKDQLVIAAPTGGVLELPAAYDPSGAPREVNIHGNEMQAFDMGDEAARFVTEALGRQVRLVRASRESVRQVPAAYQRQDASNVVAGADGMPILLASEASLADLISRQRLRAGERPLDPSEVALGRYRANIEISGESFGAFREDYLRKVQVGEMAAYVVKACARCPVPNIDQETGEVSNVSSRLLRTRAGVQAEGAGGVFMGQNLNHIFEPGQRVSVGDPIAILSESDEPNVVVRT